VEVWTGGRYVVSPSVFSRVYHIAVPEKEVMAWKEYLARRGVSVSTRKRVGARVEVRGVRRLHAAEVNGEPVIPKEAVIRLIRDHPGIYAEAEDLLVGRPIGT
jgi:hypothetical protein